MSSRPKHVSTLSDKISGLKFMQRAKAVAEQARADVNTASSTSNAEASSSKASNGVRESPSSHAHRQQEEEKDTNEEHWTLPVRSTTSTLKRKASVSSHVSHETGWNAWLLDADEQERSREADGEGSAIRTFGTWRKRSKKRQGDNHKSDTQEATSIMSEAGQRSGISDEESASSDSDIAIEDLRESGFIKPGSLTSKGGRIKHTKESARTDSNSSKAARGQNEAHTASKKKRATSDRPLLTGFSDLGRAK